MRHRKTCCRTCRNGLEEFADNLVDAKASTVREAQASSSHEPPHPKPPPQLVTRKHCIFYALRERPKLRSMQKDQNYDGALQKMHRYPSTSDRKIGVLITADRKVLTVECESRYNHRYAVVVQDRLLNGYRLIFA